ncbi:MAG: LysR family transcriptional regulator [Verrucomicrobiae bacterium]|nr:LysR family transcriptional regulator [Verrucomicrobiae bacterium]
MESIPRRTAPDTPMTLIQLKYFLTVAEHKNMTLSARKLFVSQPAVSRQLQLLENELECRLFIRGKNGMALTFEGKSLEEYARNILSRVNRLKDELNSKRNRIEGKVNIGCGAFFARFNLLDVISIIMKEHPAIDISILEVMSDEAAEPLKKGTIDLYVGQAPTNRENELHFEELFASNMVFICAKQSPWAEKQQIGLADFKKMPLVTYTPDSGVFKILAKKIPFDQARIVIQTRNSETIIACVKRDFGAGIVPEYIARALSSNNLVIKPLQLGSKVRIGITHARLAPLSPAILKVMEILRERLAMN